MTKAVIIEIKRDHNNMYIIRSTRFLSTKADRRSDHITSKHARHYASGVPYPVRLRIGATARRWGSPALRICQRERVALARRATEAEPACYTARRGGERKRNDGERKRKSMGVDVDLGKLRAQVLISCTQSRMRA